jgi:hypothetical protein
LNISSIKAQITIGSTHESAVGALLDLKNQLPDSENVTSTTGGLLLPRVNLNGINDFSLIPSITAAQKKDHTGLLVYNLKVDEKLSLEKGIYQWDGGKWKKLDKVTKTEGATVRKKIYKGNNPDSAQSVSLGIFEFRITKKPDTKIYPQFRLMPNVAKQSLYWYTNEFWDDDATTETAGGKLFFFSLKEETPSPGIWTDCKDAMQEMERNEVWIADITHNHMYQIQFLIIKNNTSSVYAIIVKRY